MVKPAKNINHSLNERQDSQIRDSKAVVGNSELSTRIIDRYMDKPGVISKPSTPGLVRRVMQFSNSRLPLLSVLQRRWALSESSLPLGQSAFTYRVRSPLNYMGKPQAEVVSENLSPGAMPFAGNQADSKRHSPIGGSAILPGENTQRQIDNRLITANATTAVNLGSAILERHRNTSMTRAAPGMMVSSYPEKKGIRMIDTVQRQRDSSSTGATLVKPWIGSLQSAVSGRQGTGTTLLKPSVAKEQGAKDSSVMPTRKHTPLIQAESLTWDTISSMTGIQRQIGESGVMKSELPFMRAKVRGTEQLNFNESMSSSQSNSLKASLPMPLQRTVVTNFVSRQTNDMTGATPAPPVTESLSVPTESEQKSIEPELLADKVYEILVNRLAIERERRGL